MKYRSPNNIKGMFASGNPFDAPNYKDKLLKKFVFVLKN